MVGETIVGKAREEISLVELVKREKLAFLDSNALTCSSFTYELYECQRFRQVNIQHLEQVAEHLAQIHGVLGEPGVRIIDGVANEFRSLKQILIEKSDFLKKSDKRLAYRKKYIPQESLDTAQESLFNQICWRLPKLEEKLSRRIFKPEKPEAYQELVELLKYLRTELHLHKQGNDNYPQQYKNKRFDHREICTDQKIAAAAIYSSICEGTSNAIVTNDSDIIILAGSFCSIISNNAFAAERDKIHSLIKANPSRMYKSDDQENYYLYADLNTIPNQNRPLRLCEYDTKKQLSPEKNEEARQKIASCLKTLVRYSSSNETLVLVPVQKNPVAVV
jgi:hypothetical protein